MTKRTLIFINLFLILTFSTIGQAQTSTFTFQGKLDDNSIAAQGMYQMKFSLFDAAAGGTQTGATIENTTVEVVNGVFTVQLDFGGMAFDGTDRFIEVEVCKSACPTYTTLNPRQQVTSSPYAIKSQNAANATTADTATNATQLGGVAASQFIQEGDARLTDDRPPTAGSGNYIQNTTTEQAASNFHISGTGTANIFDADTEYRIGGNRILSTGSVNLFVGIGAGANGNSGTDFGNSFFGQNAGATNMDGTRNSFFGADAGKNTTGNNNIALGFEAGNALTTGDNNIAIGNAGVAAESDTIRIGNTQTNTFIAGVINGDGSGLTNVNAATATTATTATNFSGSLSGDVTGTQSATVVSTVGTVTAANVASGANAANAATDTNTVSTIVKRDGSGNFSAGTINANGLSLPTTNASGDEGVITQNGDRLMHTFGTDNFFAGINAGNFIMTGNFNTASGRSALSSNSTGSQNTATGAFALNNNTTGTGNTASGQGALSSNTTGSQNTASGAQVLQNNSTGSSNTATGRSTLFSNTTGSQNTATGAFALNNNTTGFHNTASGSGALQSNTLGNYNTAVGTGSLDTNTIGNNNIAIGKDAGNALTTGDNNIAIGNAGVAAESDTIRIGNTQTNTFIAGVINGDGSGLTNVNAATATTATNFSGSLSGDVTGTQSATVVSTVGTVTAANVASGANAANAATDANTVSTIVKRDGSGNFSAGTINADGLSLPTTNAAGDEGVITQNGNRLIHTFGNANFFSGANAGNFTMTGGFNTASGINSLSSNTTGSDNTASGVNALFSNTEGSNNTAFGRQALRLNTTGNNNTASGFQALNNNTIGVENTASGRDALFSNMMGNSNTASGVSALLSNTDGDNNAAYGVSALRLNTTGNNNTASGRDALLNNTMGSNNIALGFRAGNALTTGDNNIAIGNAGVAAESDTIRIGNTQTNTFIAGVINGDGSGLTNVNAATATTATTATNFSGSLSGDVTGTQGATVVSTVGSVSAANVASGANAANAATDANTAGTIVKRDGSGNFSAGTINANGLSLPTTNAAGDEGVVTQNGNRLIHTFGSNNFFAGANAGNFTMSGSFNTASGVEALQNNMTGELNTASGAFALNKNTGGNNNTASGVEALFSNTGGNNNIASGFQALWKNTGGNDNTATGTFALRFNTTGSDNTASGRDALFNNTTGNNNIALGFEAGNALTTGNNNIAIGNAGVAGESDTIRIGNAQTSTFIAGISGATSSGGVAVFVNGSGQLGTVTSSRRFKDNIFDMDKTSEVIFSLRPVRFIYKPELDKNSIPQWGLIAEEVNEVSPDLVIRNAEGEIQTVRYEQINAMMLNEVIKQHRRVENLISEKETTQERLTELEDQNKQLQEENEKIQTQVKQQQTVIDGLLIMICADKPDAAICKEAKK